MKLGLGIDGGIGRIAESARLAEAAGFESCWVVELEHSAFVQAAAAAMATHRIAIGTGIVLAFPRSPTITAMEAADLWSLSGGRFRLGLGAQVRRSWKPASAAGRLRTTRNYAGILRLHGREAVVNEVRRAFVRGDHDRMIQAIDDELLDSIAIAGHPDEARQRLAAWEGVAETAILAVPFHGVGEAFGCELWHAVVEVFGRPGNWSTDRPRG